MSQDEQPTEDQDHAAALEWYKEDLGPGAGFKGG